MYAPREISVLFSCAELWIDPEQSLILDPACPGHKESHGTLSTNIYSELWEWNFLGCLEGLVARGSLQRFDLAQAFLADCIDLTYIYTYMRTQRNAAGYWKKYPMPVVNLSSEAVWVQAVRGGRALGRATGVKALWLPVWRGPSLPGRRGGIRQPAVCHTTDWAVSSQPGPNTAPLFNAMHINISEQTHWMMAMWARLCAWPL